MKKLITSAFLCPCLFLILVSNVMAGQAKSSVDVSIDVPDPGWMISIVSMHVQQGKLLVVCQAKHSPGIHAAVISQAKASVRIKKTHAALPREIYLLGRTWNWGKGYTAITPAQLKKRTAESELVYTAAAKAPTTHDFIGLTLKEAQALADQHKIPHRVVMIDGKPLRVTRDYRPNRLNFTVEKGKVTAVTKG